MGRGAAAPCAVAHSLLLFCELHELLEVVVRGVGAGHDHRPTRRQHRQGCKIFHGVIGHFGLQDGHVHMGERQSKKYRVPVRRGLGHKVGGDDAAGTGLGVDDDRLAPTLLQLLAVHAGQRVYRPARGTEGHDADHAAGEGGWRLRQRGHCSDSAEAGKSEATGNRHLKVSKTKQSTHHAAPAWGWQWWMQQALNPAGDNPPREAC